jgi:hypothetical protein
LHFTNIVVIHTIASVQQVYPGYELFKRAFAEAAGVEVRTTILHVQNIQLSALSTIALPFETHSTRLLQAVTAVCE